MRVFALRAMPACDRRALWLGTLVIVAAIVGVRGLPAFREWSETSVASAREVVAEANRAHRSVLGARALSDSTRARSERFIALAPALLDGKSAATAGATLASIISGAAAASQAKLGSVQVRTDTAARDSSGVTHRTFARVAVRANVTADVHGLSRFLLSLERGLTLLSIDELSITQPEPGADSTRPETLQVDIVVAGLALTARRTTR